MQTLTYNLRPERPMAKSGGEDPGFWAGLGALVVAVGGNLVALFLGIRNRKSEDHKTDATLKLQADGQEFDHERELWDRLQALENNLNAERKTIISLERGQVELAGKLNAALHENAMLRQRNEEQQREYMALQYATDLEIKRLQAALATADEERHRMQDELAGLRAQVENRTPGEPWGEV